METYRILTKRDSAQERELAGGDIAVMANEDLLQILKERNPLEWLDLSRRRVIGADLSGMDLRNINFACTRFEQVNFDGADMDGDDVSRCFFVECSFRNVKLTNADASDSSLRYLDLTGCDFSGTNFYYAALEFATMDDVKTDERTRYFGDAVPKEGAFTCWKVAPGGRVIELRVPADAGRVCATSEAGRCEKAYVVNISSVDGRTQYTWATALVDDEFIYEKGKMVYPDNGFSDYGWLDDSPGIHFFMDREMAIAFGTGYY